MTGMSEIPGARRRITVDVDSALNQRLMEMARWQGVSKEDLLARMIEQYPKNSGQRSVTVEVSESAATRLGAAAATIGMSQEELIVEAIDTYSPVKAARWPGLAFPALLAALPLVLLFVSPPVGRSASAVAWTVFAFAMLACCAGAGYWIVVALWAEWMVIKYGIAGLVSMAGCGALAVLSAFTYVYWLLASLTPGSFNLPLSRVDAAYFTLGTFTTTGTGRFVAQSSLAELLVSCQVVLGWGFVAVLLALLVPRAAAARKRLSTGRIIVRARSTD